MDDKAYILTYDQYRELVTDIERIRRILADAVVIDTGRESTDDTDVAAALQVGEMRDLFGAAYSDIVYYDFASGHLELGDYWRKKQNKEPYLLDAGLSAAFGLYYSDQLKRGGQKFENIAKFDGKGMPRYANGFAKPSLREIARVWKNKKALACAVVPVKRYWLYGQYMDKFMKHPDDVMAGATDRRAKTAYTVWVARNMTSGTLEKLNWQRQIGANRSTTISCMLEYLHKEIMR